MESGGAGKCRENESCWKMIGVIQVCAPASNAEEVEAEWFCEDLQDRLELTPKKDVFFIIGDWNANKKYLE